MAGGSALGEAPTTSLFVGNAANAKKEGASGQYVVSILSKIKLLRVYTHAGKEIQEIRVNLHHNLEIRGATV